MRYRFDGQAAAYIAECVYSARAEAVIREIVSGIYADGYLGMCSRVSAELIYKKHRRPCTQATTCLVFSDRTGVQVKYTHGYLISSSRRSMYQ